MAQILVVDDQEDIVQLVVKALELQNKGQVFSKEQIYTHLYGYEDKGSPTAVAEHIKNIRAKLKNVGQSPIETVWGIGYKWH